MDQSQDLMIDWLYVIIDSRLTMADHVAAVCRSCYYQLRQLRSVAIIRGS